MKTLCEIVRGQIGANFLNLETAIKTYNRFPEYVSPHTAHRLKDGLYDE